MKYDHIVYIEEKNAKWFLCIDRVLDSGKRNFMTHLEIVKKEDGTEDFALMEKSAEWLGNSILIDSPKFREFIGIEDEIS